MNKVLQGNLMAEAAESIKAKHLTVTTLDQSYMHCLEIKNTEDRYYHGNTHTTTAHYYCYNVEQEVLKHVIIGNDNEITVIENW